jgi:hypothetical protein
MRYLALSLLLLAACPAAPARTKQAAVPPTLQSIPVDLDNLSEVRFAQRAPVAGTDGTVSVQVPGRFPGRIVHGDPTAGGPASVVEGILASDAPLRFLRAGDIMKAESFDGAIVYEAVERITKAAPWSPERVAQGCCSWQENTLWRAAPGAPQAGLLRAVRSPRGDWSVLDWHQPSRIEPTWRLTLTEGYAGVAAAAVSPRADQVLVVLTDAKRKAIIRALAPADGHTLWTTELTKPASGLGAEGRLVYSFDGARFAVLVQDLSRCESCVAIAVFESQTGKHVRTVPVKTILSPRFSTIGLAGDTAWIFEHVLPKVTDMSTRPERCQYEAHDLATGAVRTIEHTASEWDLASCSTFALLPRFGKDGVVGLSVSGAGLTVLTADEAP